MALFDYLAASPALIISTLALLFTVGSFWWMNWRRGRLHVSGPRSYAAIGSNEGKVVLEFPFVFFNDGPTPIIIQNMRLAFLHEKQVRPLVYTATVKKLGKDEDRSMAAQFPVRGREALLLICEFQREPGNMIFEARSYPIELQAVLDDSKKWRRICQFSLNVSGRSLVTINERFIVHDNKVEQ